MKITNEILRSKIEEQGYSRYFGNVLPVSFHESYQKNLDFSDKIILPKSVLLDIKRRKPKLPIAFEVCSERRKKQSLLCVPYEFTAPEGFIYLPQWMYLKLGYKTFRYKQPARSGYGLFLQYLPETLRKCEKLYVYTSKEVSKKSLLKSLRFYTLASRDSIVPVLDNNEKKFVKVVDLKPRTLCVINEETKVKIVKDKLTIEKAYLTPGKLPQETSSPKVFENKLITDDQTAEEPQISRKLGIYEINQNLPKVPKFLKALQNKGKTRFFLPEIKKTSVPSKSHPNHGTFLPKLKENLGLKVTRAKYYKQYSKHRKQNKSQESCKPPKRDIGINSNLGHRENSCSESELSTTLPPLYDYLLRNN